MLARVYQQVHSAYRGSSECAIRGIRSKSYIQITGVDEGLEGWATPCMHHLQVTQSYFGNNDWDCAEIPL